MARCRCPFACYNQDMLNPHESDQSDRFVDWVESEGLLRFIAPGGDDDEQADLHDRCTNDAGQFVAVSDADHDAAFAVFEAYEADCEAEYRIAQYEGWSR